MQMRELTPSAPLSDTSGSCLFDHQGFVYLLFFRTIFSAISAVPCHAEMLLDFGKVLSWLEGTARIQTAICKLWMAVYSILISK